jgi:Flp pilus assembly protein TadD
MCRIFLASALLLFCTASATAADIEWLRSEVVNKARLAAVTVESGNDFTVSGFFATEDGLVVTSATNLSGAKNVTVVTEAGKRLPGAKLMAIDPNYNLAVLATGKKPPAWLQVRKEAAGNGEPCVVLYNGGGAFIKATDGILAASGRIADLTGAGFQDCWFVVLAPDKLGLNGAPAITGDGHVSGLCFSMIGVGIQKLNFFTPETTLREVLARAREATKPLPTPAGLAGSKWDLELLDDTSMTEALRLASTGDLAGTIPHLRAALTRHPDNPVVIEHLGGACMAVGEKKEAEMHLRESLRIAPQFVNNHLLLGLLLERKGDDQATLRYFQDLTTRFPQFGTAWGTLSDVLLRTGDKTGALAAAKKWTELQPGVFIAWDAYALALAATGDSAAADRARDKSRELEDYVFKVRYTAPKRK